MSSLFVFLLFGGMGLFFFIFILFKASASYGKCPRCRSLVPAEDLIYSHHVHGKICQKCQDSLFKKANQQEEKAKTSPRNGPQIRTRNNSQLGIA